MRHDGTIFILVIIVIIACIWSFASDPNDALNSHYTTLEARITSIEERLTVLESRIENLRPRGPVAPAPAESDAGELAKKKLTRQFEDAKAAVLRDENGIHQINPRFAPITPHKIHQKDVPEFMRALDDIKDNKRTYIRVEQNIEKMIRLAENNPDLGFDVDGMKKRLIKCQANRDINERDLARIRDLAEYNRELFKFVPR